MNEFGKKIKELRGNKSIREAARGIGISHTYLDSLEKGYDARSGNKRTPTIEMINKISLYYNYDFAELTDLAGLFVPMKDTPQEQIDIQIKKFKEKMANKYNKLEFDVKNNYIHLLDNKLEYSETQLLKQVYLFIRNSEDEYISRLSVILNFINQEKNTNNKEAYNDLMKEFEDFANKYLSIEQR